MHTLLLTPELYESFVLYTSQDEFSIDEFKKILLKKKSPKRAFKEDNVFKFKLLTQLQRDISEEISVSHHDLCKKFSYTDQGDIIMLGCNCDFLFKDGAATVCSLQTYEYGQYYPYVQHLFAMFCLNASHYKYYIYANGEMYTEEYQWHSTESLNLLISRINSLLDFLKSNSLWDIFCENWYF